MQLGDGTANNGSVPGDIVDDRASTIANDAPSENSGVISGNGSLMKAGRIFWSLAEQYIQRQYADRGSEVLLDRNSASPAKQPLDMNAADTGTLDMGGNANVVLGGLQGTRNLAIAAGATLTVGNNGDSTIYSGILSGSAPCSTRSAAT